MKKIIATTLCLVLGAPCFAAGPHYQGQPRHYSYSQQHMMTPPQKPQHQCYKSCHHMSNGAKTTVAVAGVVGLAMIVAAIVD